MARAQASPSDGTALAQALSIGSQVKGLIDSSSWSSACRWMLRRIEEPQAVPQIAAVLSVMLGLDLALFLLLAIPIPPIAVVAWASKWLGGFWALRFMPSAA